MPHLTPPPPSPHPPGRPNVPTPSPPYTRTGSKPPQLIQGGPGWAWALITEHRLVSRLCVVLRIPAQDSYEYCSYKARKTRVRADDKYLDDHVPLAWCFDMVLGRSITVFFSHVTAPFYAPWRVYPSPQARILWTRYMT